MDLFSAKFVFLAVVALVVLGPDKLPAALRAAGRLLAELRRLSAGVQAQSRSMMTEAGLAEPIAELRSVSRTLRNPLVGMGGTARHPTGTAADSRPTTVSAAPTQTATSVRADPEPVWH